MPQQTRDKIEERRQLVYDLYLLNYTVQSISEALQKRGIAGSSSQNVHDDIVILRKRNAAWFDKHKDPEARMRSLYKEVEDQLRKVENELWTNYYNTPSKDVGVRNALLANLRSTILGFAQTMGVVAPRIRDVWLEGQLTLVEQEHKKLAGYYQKKIHELEAEKNLAQRVRPGYSALPST